MLWRFLFGQHKQFGLLLESQEFLLGLTFQPVDLFPSLFQPLVKTLHELLVFFLADRLGHWPRLKTLLEL